ncbi:MAG: diacylglycerol/lipid kinase family protein [Phenylobacterium sp.]
MRLLDQPGVSIRRVQAIVNPASGGVRRGMADELAALFAEFGLDHRVSELVPGRFEAVVRAALDTGPDLVVVLGGDGTARLVAELCGPAGPLVAPLCGGTMNKLGRALYGSKPWREALSGALTRGAVRWMPGGEVDGHAFYCRAVLGPPALWARAREAVRVRQLGRAWRRAVVARRNAFSTRLNFELDGQIVHGLAISLICPTVSRALDEDEGALEMAVVDLRDTRAGARLALSSLLGDWREDPDVLVRPCVRGRAWANHPIPAMLDGEFFRLGRKVETRFRPHAFRALAPGPE